MGQSTLLPVSLILAVLLSASLFITLGGYLHSRDRQIENQVRSNLLTIHQAAEAQFAQSDALSLGVDELVGRDKPLARLPGSAAKENYQTLFPIQRGKPLEITFPNQRESVRLEDPVGPPLEDSPEPGGPSEFP